MDFPMGFPARLKPRVEAAIAKASRKFLENQELGRIEAGFYAFAEIAVKAAEDGEYDVASAHSALHQFLDYMFANDPCGPPVKLIHPTLIAQHFKFDIRRSGKWVRYMERLDAITKRSERTPKDKPAETSRSLSEKRK